MLKLICPVADTTADPFGKRNKFRQGPNLQLLHNLLSVGFDRALGPAQRAGDMLVGVADNDKVEDLPLARCQRCDKRANDVQLSLLIASHFMPCESPLDCGKQIVGRYRLGEEVFRARLDGRAP